MDGVRINKVSNGWSQDKQGFQWMVSGYRRFPMDGVRIYKVFRINKDGWFQDIKVSNGWKVSKGWSQDKQGFQWIESGYTRFSRMDSG